MKERQPKSGFSFVKWVIILVLILAICLVTFFCIKSLPIFGQEKASLSSSNIVTALQTSSELITSKVNFRGIAKYSDEGVPVINKGDFVMVYTATVKAGIDIDKVKSAVDNQNKIVYIYLPDAEVLDVKVNTEGVSGIELIDDTIYYTFDITDNEIECKPLYVSRRALFNASFTEDNFNKPRRLKNIVVATPNRKTATYSII